MRIILQRTGQLFETVWFSCEVLGCFNVHRPLRPPPPPPPVRLPAEDVPEDRSLLVVWLIWLPRSRAWACEFRLCEDSRDGEFAEAVEGCRVCLDISVWPWGVEDGARLPVEAVCDDVPAPLGGGLFTVSQPLPVLLLQLPELSFLYTLPSLPAYTFPDLVLATAPCPFAVSHAAAPVPFFV